MKDFGQVASLEKYSRMIEEQLLETSYWENPLFPNQHMLENWQPPSSISINMPAYEWEELLALLRRLR